MGGLKQALAVAATAGADVESRDRAGTFSADGWEALATWGALGLGAPPALGGGGLPLPEVATAHSALAEGCVDGGLLFAMHAHLWGCLDPILRFGTAEQQARWAPGLIRGGVVGALAVTESGSGSSVFSMAGEAARDGADWVVSGEKVFVTNAPAAGLFVVLARTSSGPAMSSFTAFVLERGAPGLAVAERLDTLGLRTAPIAGVRMDRCRVGDGDRLGAVGGGAALFLDAMEGERIGMAAMHAGVMARQVARCERHVRTRRIAGTSLSAKQAVAHRIAEMRTRLHGVRGMVRGAAERRDSGLGAGAEAAMAKLASSEALVAGCVDAMRIFGAAGFLVGSGVERELRDAMAALTYSGTSDVQREVIAGLAGLR